MRVLKPYPYPHEVAIAAILKNEAPYVKEWLDYHIAAGVTKFYLYDNDSTDNLTDVLKPYIDSGTVEYTWLPGKFMQFPAYNDAVRRHKFDCRYLAVIDLDEFIYPCSGQSIPAAVDEIFALDNKVGGYAVNWRVYGSSGHTSKDFSRGVLDRFKRRGSADFSDNICVKSILNPRCVEVIVNPHFAYYYPGKYAVNDQGGVVPYAQNKPLPNSKTVINHYLTKSREEYAAKKNRGWADVAVGRTWEDFARCDVNDVFDGGILTYRSKMLANPLPGGRRKPQDVLGAIAKDFPALTTTELTERLDDVLAYRYFCRTELPHCVGKGRSAAYHTALVDRALTMAFDTAQSLWQLKLFLSIVSEVLPEYKSLVMPCVRKVVPQLLEYYAVKNQRREYCELDRLLKFCQVACA